VRDVLVQGHRGGGAQTPENTIESFTTMWELGIVPEADLRTTRDGVIVAFHDARLDRVVTDLTPDLRDKGVQDLTFQELSALDVGSSKDGRFTGQRICSVEQIFTLMRGHPDRALYMDIKDARLPRLADLVQVYEVAAQVIVAAPDEQLLRDWRHLVHDGQTLLWMGILWNGDEATLGKRLEHLRDERFAGITQLQIHVQATRQSGGWQYRPSLEFLRRTAGDLEACGVLFQALPWDCADAGVYHALLEVGVRSFASDYPEVALRVLREHTPRAIRTTSS
jgi:glycerophosphoryl diester phosphodiesterase